MPDADVTLHQPPDEHGHAEIAGHLVDTPESRAALELTAIPGCQPWREANRELIGPPHAHQDAPCGPACTRPAPYCCSAYCPRCAGMRALDGEQPLRPNQWMGDR